MVATLPFLLVSCLTILFYELGLSFFSGISVFIIAIITNIEVSRRRARMQKEYMKKQDARISLTTECLNNIKMLKLYSWIDIFIDLIAKRRQEELAISKRNIWLGITTVTTLYFFPLMLQSVSFITYILFGNQIDLSKAFVILTVLSLIQQPIRAMPMFIGQMIEFSVSMKRIQKFLLCDEIVPSIIKQQEDSTSETALAIKNSSNFHWGYVSVEEMQRHLLETRKKGKKGNESVEVRHSEVNDVSSLLALKGLELEIKRGQFVCIIGDVGSGKSSLLSSIIGDMLHLSEAEKEEVDLDMV